VAAVFLATAFLVGGLPERADAQTRGGRIHNPKRLRARATTPRRGRIIRDPRKAPTTPRKPGRRHAIIPNPEKHAKGGSGYTKRGKYYYQKPGQIRVGGNPKRHVERVKIPHPNKKLR